MAEFFSGKLAVVADAQPGVRFDVAEEGPVRNQARLGQLGINLIHPLLLISGVQAVNGCGFRAVVLKAGSTGLQHFDAVLDVFQRIAVSREVAHDEFVRTPQELDILILCTLAVLANAVVAVFQRVLKEHTVADLAVCHKLGIIGLLPGGHVRAVQAEVFRVVVRQVFGIVDILLQHSDALHSQLFICHD